MLRLNVNIGIKWCKNDENKVLAFLNTAVSLDCFTILKFIFHKPP